MFTLKPAKACQALISYIWSCDISPALVLALTSYIWSCTISPASVLGTTAYYTSYWPYTALNTCYNPCTHGTHAPMECPRCEDTRKLM